MKTTDNNITNANTISFSDFLNNVNPVYRDFVADTHEYMLENGFVVKIIAAKKGYVVSYLQGKKGHVAANYVFRKNGLIIRIYGDHVGHYSGLLETLPEAMTMSIEKAPVCRRLVSGGCNSRCRMGNDFIMKGENYKKCRYSCFMFDVTHENIPHITDILENEVRCRVNHPAASSGASV